MEEIRASGYILTPGRYVGTEVMEDDGEPFEQKRKRLTAELETRFNLLRRYDSRRAIWVTGDVSCYSTLDALEPEGSWIIIRGLS